MAPGKEESNVQPLDPKGEEGKRGIKKEPQGIMKEQQGFEKEPTPSRRRARLQGTQKQTSFKAINIGPKHLLSSLTSNTAGKDARYCPTMSDIKLTQVKFLQAEDQKRKRSQDEFKSLPQTVDTPPPKRLRTSTSPSSIDGEIGENIAAGSRKPPFSIVGYHKSSQSNPPSSAIDRHTLNQNAVLPVAEHGDDNDNDDDDIVSADMMYQWLEKERAEWRAREESLKKEKEECKEDWKKGKKEWKKEKEEWRKEKEDWKKEKEEWRKEKEEWKKGKEDWRKKKEKLRERSRERKEKWKREKELWERERAEWRREGQGGEERGGGQNN